MYYSDKTETLRAVFGAHDVSIETHRAIVDGRVFPIVNDVIICLDESQWPPALRTSLGVKSREPVQEGFAEDIQYTFGQEWKTFPSVRPEHEPSFRAYFDLIDLRELAEARLCDLGCGMGRWSYFASSYCREIILVDFSDAIFIARENLRDRPNALFFMADVSHLPFAKDFADLIFCLGVLHHLPTPALQEVVALRDYAKQLLVYLYYAVDSQPVYFQVLLALVTPVRLLLARIRSERVRYALAATITLFVYQPLIGLGALLRRLGLQTPVPLYEGYHGKSFQIVLQDAYDRFFTRIEQRVSRKDVLALDRHFSRVTVSEKLPYWHFLCVR